MDFIPCYKLLLMRTGLIFGLTLVANAIREGCMSEISGIAATVIVIMFLIDIAEFIKKITNS